MAGVIAPSLMTAQLALGRSSEFSVDDNFKSGTFEPAMMAGTLFSPLGSPKNRPTINYAVGTLQLGYMVTEPHGEHGVFRGNLELAPEAFGAGMFDGPGNYIAGGTLWLRYNFVQPEWCLIPYAQVGAGFTFTDTSRYLVGQNFNFNVDGALGARYFIRPRCTVNFEYRFQHISNANLGPKNVGINAQGPMLGLSVFF